VPALLLLAVALGLNNLAAAVGFGAGATGQVSGGTRVRIAVVFSLFEAGMPVLGLLLGHELADGIGEAARWLGGAALIAFGMAGWCRPGGIAASGFRRRSAVAPSRSGACCSADWC
jgi:putative Mn2+ efflux pump MntP